MYKVAEVGNINVPNDPKLNFNSTLYTLNTYPWGPNCGPFHSTISLFRDTTCIRSPKSEVYRMTPNWTWTLNSQNTLYMYTLNTTSEAQILVRFTLQPAVSKISTFYNSSLTTMWNGQIKNKKNCQKFKFHYSFNNFGRDIHEFWAANLVCCFRGDVVWHFYPHMVPC